MTKKDKTESRYTITYEADEKVSDEQRKGDRGALDECKVEINKIIFP